MDYSDVELASGSLDIAELERPFERELGTGRLVNHEYFVMHDIVDLIFELSIEEDIDNKGTIYFELPRDFSSILKEVTCVVNE